MTLAPVPAIFLHARNTFISLFLLFYSVSILTPHPTHTHSLLLILRHPRRRRHLHSQTFYCLFLPMTFITFASPPFPFSTSPHIHLPLTWEVTQESNGSAKGLAIHPTPTHPLSTSLPSSFIQFFLFSLLKYRNVC